LTVDDVLLLGRIAFVVALYIFLFALALLLRRELRRAPVTEGERGPADLLVMDPGETGLEAGERLSLLTTTTIGRDSESDLVLDDTFISSEHATLSWNGNGWMIRDLGSTNGTRLNGEEVKRPTPVKLGDTVEFGRVRMKLVTV
jgi:FHA domain